MTEEDLVEEIFSVVGRDVKPPVGKCGRIRSRRKGGVGRPINVKPRNNEAVKDVLRGAERNKEKY
jgi:hypothetical protein